MTLSPKSSRILIASVAACLAGSSLVGANRNEPPRRGHQCDNRTLAGDWGVSVSGVRAAGPGATESFIGVAVRTYDGYGSFTEAANSHGQLSGATTPQIAGTYQVNPDCTGRAQFVPPGAPIVVESAFVIVDRGAEVREIVLSPQPNLVTAVQRRID